MIQERTSVQIATEIDTGVDKSVDSYRDRYRKIHVYRDGLSTEMDTERTHRDSSSI